jgi:uncharacterized protein
MDLTPLIPQGRQIVESYGDGKFRVSNALFETSILVFPDRTIAWPVADIRSLSLESLAPIATAGESGVVNLLLIGCGSRMAMIPAALRTSLRAKGIVIEPMDTGAACRTYNVLAAEGRKVAAALIVV